MGKILKYNLNYLSLNHKGIKCKTIANINRFKIVLAKNKKLLKMV